MLWAYTASPDWGSGFTTAASSDSVSVCLSYRRLSLSSPISAAI